MNVNEVINFKKDLEKGRYISAIELIEIVESFNDGISPKDLVMFLETLNIFSMRLHPFNEYNGEIHYGYPQFDEQIGEKIADFLYLRENHTKDKNLYDAYASKLYQLENTCWHRIDLLRVEGFVKNTDIVNWGKKHILQRVYADMTGETHDIISTFPKYAQQGIFKILKRMPPSDNSCTHTQEQTIKITNNSDKMQAKIADLEKQLEQAHADNNLLRKEVENNIEVKSTNKQPKNQDSKIVVYLAFILAQKLPKYRKNNLNINAQQVGEAITAMAQGLGLDKDDMHGFKRPDARLRALINDNKELLSHFENLIKENEKNQL